MPAILRRLARHSSITTTLAYYVDLDADAVADELWAKHATGNTTGNIQPKEAQSVITEAADALDARPRAECL